MSEVHIESFSLHFAVLLRRAISLLKIVFLICIVDIFLQCAVLC